MIAENLEQVRNNIRLACKKSGRNEEDVTLVAVSKYKPAEDILEAYAAGQRVFGENHVQEIVEKTGVLPQDITWHMIGHLQRNKVKPLMHRVTMIQSVDSLRLARQISSDAQAADVTMPVLMEVNMAAEESKYGFSPEEAKDAAKTICSLPGISLAGLMTIAPICDNPEDNRRYFAGLRMLAADIRKLGLDHAPMTELSMGMTGDYTVAVEEGATLVRVGTGIFGARDYSAKN